MAKAKEIKLRRNKLHNINSSYSVGTKVSCSIDTFFRNNSVDHGNKVGGKNGLLNFKNSKSLMELVGPFSEKKKMIKKRALYAFVSKDNMHI